MTTVRIATRGSRLALAQAEMALAALRVAQPERDFELLTIETDGDRDQVTPLADLGGRGIFAGSLREALLADRADLAVHSLKDVPTLPVRGLVVGAVLERGDPRDVFVSKTGAGLGAMPSGSRIGTSSTRRTAVIQAVYPELETVPVRGNVDTRLRKLREGEVDGLLLAGAGLQRLKLRLEVSEWLDLETFIPAPAQGVVAIECRSDDAAMVHLTTGIDHLPTRTAATAERAFLAVQGADCSLPVGAYAWLEGGRLGIRGTLTGDPSLAGTATGNLVEAADLGRRLGRQLRARAPRGDA